MSTTFAQPADDFATTLAVQHNSGSGTLVLSASPGTLASGRVWRVTALSNPDLSNESVLGIFQATSSSTVTLSGVTAVEGTSDSTLDSGTAIQIRMTALDLAEVQTALNAAETTIASQGTAITTIQTNQTADEATLASHTTELASHAASLATDATAITSLQTSRTTDETELASHATELASHATELASHAASLATDATAITTIQTNQTADEATLASHTTELASHASSISTLNSEVATNTSGISTNAAAITTLNGDVTTIDAAIAALQAIEIPTVWCSGDSLTYGTGLSSPSTQSIVAQTAALLGAGWSLVNEGRSGYTAAQLATADLTLLDPVWSWQRPQDIVFFWAGTNDLYFGATAEQTYLNIVGYCQARRLAGRRVIVTSMLPRLLGSGSWLEADRQTVNGLIDANWPTFADEFFDIAGITAIGAFGANLNATNYQSDNTHLTAAGVALAAPGYAAAILRLASRTIVQADGPNTFTEQQSFTGYSSNSSIRVGSLEVQAIALNNTSIADNAYNNGSGWVYRSTGTASLIYFVGGIVAFYTAPSGTAGASVPWVESFQINADSTFTASLGMSAPTFTGTVGMTSATYATTGSGAGYVLTRRDTSAAAFQLYSAAGVLQVYSYTAGGVVATIDASGNLVATSLSGTGGSLTGIPESGVTGLTSALALLAPLASPALTGTPTAPTASNGTNTTQIATTAFVLANGGGGSSGDMLATLVNSPVSITGTTALTSSAFDAWQVCSGTSGNYAVTLPAPVAGKTIGFRMDPALTVLVTITQNASELIDGAASRVMWAGETAVLLSDGTNWFKVAGKPIPFVAVLNRHLTNFSIPGSYVQTTLPMDSLISGPAFMLSSGNAVIPRPGSYNLIASAYVIGGTGPPVNGYIGINVNANANQAGAVYFEDTSSQLVILGSTPALWTFSAGDTVSIGLQMNVASSAAATSYPSALYLAEIPSW